MKKIIKYLLISGVVFWVAQTNFANTNYVGTAGTSSGNYYTDIQSAVDATLAGGLVLVSNGVYKTGETITPYGELTNRVVVLTNITIRSISGPQSTIIVGGEGINGDQGTGAVRCVYMEKGELLGFTLSNGCTLITGGSYLDKSGGGIFILYAYDGIVSNCVIVNCKGGEKDGNDGGGGGVCIWGGNIDNCVLSRNKANFGGAAYIIAGEIRSSSIINNYSGYDGGGVYMEDGELSNCIIAGNYAKNYGGGIGGYGGTIKNCQIVNNSVTNSSDGFGGGMHCFNNMIVINCSIMSNSAYYGGGIQCYSTGGNVFSNCVISANIAAGGAGGLDIGNNSQALNCLINNNSAAFWGGGVYFAGGTLRNCTVVSNYSNNGGGVYCENYASNVNSIIYYNKAINGTNYVNNGSAANIVYEYCCSFPPLTNGIGNISGDPDFVNPNAGNWKLSAGSQCIDAGTNAYAPLPVDLDGNPRIIGGRVDMGCYEAVPEPFYLSFIIYYLLFINRKFIFTF